MADADLRLGVMSISEALGTVTLSERISLRIHHTTADWCISLIERNAPELDAINQHVSGGSLREPSAEALKADNQISRFVLRAKRLGYILQHYQGAAFGLFA